MVFLTVRPSSCFQGSFRVATEHGTAIINSNIGETGNVIVGKYGDETSKDSIDLKSTYSIVRLALPVPTDKKSPEALKPQNNEVDPPKQNSDGKPDHQHGKGGKKHKNNDHKAPHKNNDHKAPHKNE